MKRFSWFHPCVWVALACILPVPSAIAGLLDKRALLDRQTFWSNRDQDWYLSSIPFFECPDEDIETTYYYRWELVTRHLTYGSPNTGYTLTEFANRPFWSGRYGAIVCPAGHQTYEVRWLRDPMYARDFLKYWFRTPGAQPRRYSSWLADCTWATHQVHPNDDFTLGLYPDLLRHHEIWKDRQWVADMGLFWQLGHDDGMEFDINAQQTQDILRGGQSLRPSFNAYMWADMVALAKMATLAGDPDSAGAWTQAADALKDRLQTALWDPDRDFFFPMSNQRHVKDGHTVEKHTLTYETGRFAGSPHGRELHGYVPWAFSMPDPGHESAWRFLMDPDYFYAEHGPTTVERQDPLFVLKEGCCWWSGQSWPFATTQTLKAMANLLHGYEQDYVSRRDYTHLLSQFAASHRKDGRPYIAEALNPFDGSWRHHDFRNRSEHYFHSGFVDLVVTGLAGLVVRDDDRVVIDPLFPKDWDYFAIEDIPYKGNLLTIAWDRGGDRYGLGRGLHLLMNGEPAAHSEELEKIQAQLPGVRSVPVKRDRLLNYAVNSDGDYYPALTASFVSETSDLSMVVDGQRRYDTPPMNRATTVGSPNREDWIQIDLGTPRQIDRVQLYFVDDSEGVVAPTSFELEHHDGDAWVTVPDQTRTPKTPMGGRPNTVLLEGFEAQRFRVRFEHAPQAATGLTEIEFWGPGELPYEAPPPPAGNLAFGRDPNSFPRASASFSDAFGGVPSQAIDGRIIFQAIPFNRWTSFGSPNRADWLEIRFGEVKKVGRLELHIYDDGGGVQAPRSYTVQHLENGAWKDVQEAVQTPARPQGDIKNTVTFRQVSTPSIRVVFTHEGNARSGVTELEAWEE